MEKEEDIDKHRKRQSSGQEGPPVKKQLQNSSESDQSGINGTRQKETVSSETDRENRLWLERWVQQLFQPVGNLLPRNLQTGHTLSEAEVLVIQTHLTFLPPRHRCIYHCFYFCSKAKMPDRSPVPMLPADGEIVLQFWMTRQVPQNAFPIITRIGGFEFAVDCNGNATELTREVVESTETSDYRDAKLNADSPKETLGISSSTISGYEKSLSCTQDVPSSAGITEFENEVSDTGSPTKILPISADFGKILSEEDILTDSESKHCNHSDI